MSRGRLLKRTCSVSQSFELANTDCELVTKGFGNTAKQANGYSCAFRYNLPLCDWSSQLFDLRAPSSTDIPVLLLNYAIYEHLMWSFWLTQYTCISPVGVQLPLGLEDARFSLRWSPSCVLNADPILKKSRINEYDDHSSSRSPA